MGGERDREMEGEGKGRKTVGEGRKEGRREGGGISGSEILFS